MSQDNESNDPKDDMDIGQFIGGITEKPPSANLIMQYFTYSHVQSPRDDVANLYADLAMTLDDWFGDSEQKTVALQRLLESKDAALRAAG